MTEVKYEETLIASVVVDKDRQLTLHQWKNRTPDGVSLSTERGWMVGLYDSDGNYVMTLARTEGTTSVAANIEEHAWAIFLALLSPITMSHVRNTGMLFDLGSGPERTKA